jgi:hypothetical protein
MSTTATTLTNTCVDFAKLADSCLVTLTTTCLNFPTDEHDADIDIVCETAMEVLKSRGLTKPDPNIAAFVADMASRGATVSRTIPHVIDPEKLGEETLEQLFLHIFDGTDFADFDETPEGYLRRYILRVDREGKPLPEAQPVTN